MANEKLDLIDRGALGIGKAKREAFNNPAYADGWNCAIDIIENAPTVDAVPVVHGRWIHCKGKSNLWYCSACGEKILYNPTRRTYNIEKRPVYEVNKYCRGCGAKMDGGNEDG